MKTFKYLVQMLVIFALGLFLSACNGSGGGGSSSGSPSVSGSGIYTLPNGNVVLPNGAQVSTSSKFIAVAPGKTSSIVLKVTGGDSVLGLNLSTSTLDNSTQSQTDNSGLDIKFTKSNVSTGSTASFSTVTIDATNAVSGNYVVNVLASGIHNTASNQVNSINSNITSNSPDTIATFDVVVSPSNMLKATYLEMDATSTLAFIPSSAYAASNVIIFSFDDVTTSQINPAYVSVMQAAINGNALPNTIYLLSLGGANNATPSTFNPTNVPMIINNVTDQISAYNQQLVGGQIAGVDLDMENSITESTITGLAQGFHNNGFLVSTAPQVINLTGTNVDPANPTNLGLSSGGNNNQYGQAIAAGYINYIMAQTYNTGGWTVNGFAENQVEFYSAIAQALNNTVESACEGITTLCIPATTQIAIGEVSNGGASGTVNNIFGSNGSTSYNQIAILNQLESQIPVVQNSFPHIAGIMQWSYNSDYDPSQWNDSYALPGAFTSTIFGAEPMPPIPPFILQVTNTATVTGDAPYASATLVVNGQYMVYGTASNQPIAPQYMTAQNYQQWGTSTSSSSTVAYSSNFNNLFSNGATSFTASEIIINAYPSSSTAIGAPSGQYVCYPISGSNQTSYTFEAGVEYNLQINPVYKSCAIGIINSSL